VRAPPAAAAAKANPAAAAAKANPAAAAGQILQSDPSAGYRLVPPGP